MRDLASTILGNPALSSMVSHHRVVASSSARFAAPAAPLPAAIANTLRSRGIDALYRHQAEALDLARAGHDVLAVTPTASGKTLVFALPVLETLLRDPSAKALFLYPTKALAQDQVTTLRGLATAVSPLRPPRFEIYDGDTPQHARRKIRADPPEVLVTNPDMLHLGILAHHEDWRPFLEGLRWIVLDELHVYRGLFGSHVHHVLARLRRLAARVGAAPRIVAASATIGNPEEFAGRLTGGRFRVVRESGAPTAAREVVFLNPSGVSPYTAAVRVIAETAGRGLRTIAFTKARRVTELIHTWLARQHPDLARRVAPYRAGYLPEERRRIEERLFRGDLRAVVTTSALELGIDVGGLDACVLVGYPGSRMSSWQRIGRVGREGRDALVVLIAMPDALDQYVVAHPDRFFDGRFEHAVLDPWNPSVAGPHLVCAAAEDPLSSSELDALGGPARGLVDDLVGDGRLVADEHGTRWFSFRRRPQRDVNPRSGERPFVILEDGSGRTLGTVDAARVHQECHPEAIYLHGGRTYRIVAFDETRRQVLAREERVDHYTIVLGEKETEILERRETISLHGHAVALGRLKVTVHIRGYQKKRLFGGETIAEYPLQAPPRMFETVGFWIELPDSWPSSFAAGGRHFMGGIHAAEHAMIGLFPLLAIADRGDVGGISYVRHPQTGRPSVFLYDGVAGGAGLAEQGFRDLERLVDETLGHVSGCACEDGCPACIQSPRCGNGNKPLDKEACIRLLSALAGRESIVPVEDRTVFSMPSAAVIPSPAKVGRRHGITRRLDAAPPDAPAAAENDPVAPVAGAAAPVDATVDRCRTVVFDLETRRGAADVGGWGQIDRMGLALAVVYDVAQDLYTTYFEADVERLLLDLVMADRVVGFNVNRFDLRVLSAYTRWDLGRIRTLDLLDAIHERLGFRVKLDHLARENLGESKIADGLQSLQWWKEGRVAEIEEYCRKDVEVTYRLYELGRRQGWLVYRDRDGRRVRLPASWAGDIPDLGGRRCPPAVRRSGP